VFREACKLGCEGIVWKRLGSIYRRGRSPHWVKVKNPKAPAVKREAEEDWGRLTLDSLVVKGHLADRRLPQRKRISERPITPPLSSKWSVRAGMTCPRGTRREAVISARSQ
jgi:hypothetical protein